MPLTLYCGYFVCSTYFHYFSPKSGQIPIYGIFFPDPYKNKF